MFKTTLTLLALSTLAFTGIGLAQNAHTIPFASSSNSIELAVANESTIPISAVKVEVTNVLPWLRFSATEQRIALIKANQEILALFPFSVDKTAPVSKDHTLRFIITAPTGERWTKEITIAVAAPERFELLQNYPNPFNPTTTISYQLPAKSRVTLTIFNLLGQEVATVFEGEKEPGYHQETWSAAAASSGVYVAQVVALDDRGNRWVARRTMLLLK
jgi:hypothetical protein